MEEVGAYAAALEDALTTERGRLDGAVLAGLLESFRLFLSTYDGMFTILSRKGLIREDPYRHEDPIAEPVIPSADWFPPAEIQEQMGIRLAQLRRQLDYVVSNYKFSTEYLTLPRLRLLAGLVRYVDFTRLSDTSPSMPTAAYSTLVSRASRSPDTVAAGIAKNGARHLAELARKILREIAQVQLYQRERYKLELRQRVMPSIALEASAVAADTRAALAAVGAAARSSGIPFHSDLASEVLDEDYPADHAAGAELRSKILARIQAQAKADAKLRAGPTPSESLLDALGGLGNTETALRSALRSIRDNELLVRSRRPTALGRVRRLLLRVVGVKAKVQSYEIELADEAGGNPKVERVVYAAFLDEATAMARNLQELASRTGARRSSGASADELYDSLTMLTSELHLLVRRLEGLNTLFRAMLAAKQRTRIRGIHGDLTLVRAALNRANKQRHEYVAAREEAEQLRKLGIPPKP